MKSLPTVIEQRQFTYKQLERHGRCAIYTQTHNASGVIRYEVIHIHISHQRVLPSGEVLPEQETYPHTNLWGQQAWTFFDLTSAQKKFQELLQRSEATR